MKMYKGFERDMTCLDFKFEEGETYEEKEAVLCQTGFHACAEPLDVLTYYKPSTSVYNVSLASRDHTVAVTTGHFSVAKMEKQFGAAVSSGICSIALTCGNNNAAVATDDRSIAFANGFDSVALAMGNNGKAESVGDNNVAVVTGYNGAASVMGKHSVVIATNNGDQVMGVKGSVIILMERNSSFDIINVVTEIVDGVRIKENTWYTLKDGKLVEVEADGEP